MPGPSSGGIRRPKGPKKSMRMMVAGSRKGGSCTRSSQSLIPQVQATSKHHHHRHGWQIAPIRLGWEEPCTTPTQAALPGLIT